MIRISGVSKSFPVATGGEVQALEGIDLRIEKGDFVALVGPSGCGKTTLLNLLAGFEGCSSGALSIDGQRVSGIDSMGRLGYVTQESRLFPWLTLQANVAFPLRARGLPRADREGRVRDLLGRVGLGGFEEHYPYQLSGGMQKRASLVQAISYDPGVLLMDEPFGSLDAQTRMLLQAQLLDLWEGSGKTILFVTHDLVEALALSDRVVVLSRRPGKVKGELEVSLDRPRDVFRIHEHQGYGECYRRLWDLVASELGHA